MTDDDKRPAADDKRPTAKEVLRDPRTGEAATDPTTSRADDPTHGVEQEEDFKPATPTVTPPETEGGRVPASNMTPLIIAAVVLVAIAIVFLLL